MEAEKEKLKAEMGYSLLGKNQEEEQMADREALSEFEASGQENDLCLYLRCAPVQFLAFQHFSFFFKA